MRVFFILMMLFSVPAVGYGQSVSIFLAGDSTMAAKLPAKRPETGWGETLAGRFKPGTVRIVNRALNGRSTKTFITEGHWQAVVDDLKPGDHVLIQFGHNDSAKEKGERYTPPEDYRRNLERFVNDARNRGAVPVLLTPVVRRRFDGNGKFYDTHGDYPGIVRSVAAEHKVPLIDMHRESERMISKCGAEGSRKLFLQLKAGDHANYPNGVDDNTHFSPVGAEEMAGLAVQGIRSNDLAIRKYLVN